MRCTGQFALKHEIAPQGTVKIILSRKGFDSSAGGKPSPIFPNGEILSLPIPISGAGSRPYYQIAARGYNVGEIVESLTAGKVKATDTAHLDPDLDATSIPRETGWKPLFGQAGAAETHLQNMGVGPGDLFLFYGWFRQVQEIGGKYRYVRDAPHLHLIFGWLQIEEHLPADHLSAIPAWARYHPHCLRAKRRGDKLDSLYIARERLQLPGVTIDAPGGGVFEHYREELCLTVPGCTRSMWQLPGWFYPKGRSSALSYHGAEEKWVRQGEYAMLRSVAQGQEFVLDCDHYPEAIDWLCGLMSLAD